LIALLALLLLLMALLGAPLFAVIAGAAMLGFMSAETPLAVLGVELYRLVDTPILLALPLFTFAGYVLGESRTSLRLVRLTQALIGWMPGGSPSLRCSPAPSSPPSPVPAASPSSRWVRCCIRR